MKNFMKKMKNIGNFVNGFVYSVMLFALFYLGIALMVGEFALMLSNVYISTKITAFVMGSGIVYFLLFFVKSNSKKSLWFLLGEGVFSISLYTFFFLYTLLHYELFWATIFLVLLVVSLVFLYIPLKQIFLHNNANNVSLAFIDNDVKAGQGYNAVDFYPFRPYPNIEIVKDYIEKNKNNPELKDCIEDLERLLQLEFSILAKTKDGSYYRFMFESKEKLQKFLDENAKN